LLILRIWSDETEGALRIALEVFSAMTFAMQATLA
jgi:hypothetical protein